MDTSNRLEATPASDYVGKRNPHSLLIGILTGSATKENIIDTSQKRKNKAFT